MSDKPAFVERYLRADPEVQFLFDYLRVSLVRRLKEAGFGFRDDGKFCFDFGGVNFCCLELQGQSIRLGLRTQEYPLAVPDSMRSRRGSSDFTHIYVDSRDDLDEAMNIVSGLYQYKLGKAFAGKAPDTAHGPRSVVPSMELAVLPCLDSTEMASERQSELHIPRDAARALGQSAVRAIQDGFYLDREGTRVDWREAVDAARKARASIPPDAALPAPQGLPHHETRVQVANETTLQAAKRLVDAGFNTLALNFANGVRPGGGFLNGALAQEEGLCRSSALYATLEGDPMYERHRKRPRKDSTDWAILSPDVPVFRTDGGAELPQPWLLSFVTCAAPVAKSIGQPEAGDLLERRIHRVLAIAQAWGYDALVLGAWGCGAFGNDPWRTARDFRRALEGDFAGAFREVVFAVTDWSPERRYLGPFCEVFSP